MHSQQRTSATSGAARRTTPYSARPEAPAASSRPPVVASAGSSAATQRPAGPSSKWLLRRPAEVKAATPPPGLAQRRAEPMQAPAAQSGALRSGRPSGPHLLSSDLARFIPTPEQGVGSLSLAQDLHDIGRLMKSEDCQTSDRQIRALTLAMRAARGDFDSAAIGNACYGLHGMRACRESRALWHEITLRIRPFKGQLGALEISRACYGLRNLDNSLQARALIQALAEKIAASKDAVLNDRQRRVAQAVLQRLFGRDEVQALARADGEEVRALARALEQRFEPAPTGPRADAKSLRAHPPSQGPGASPPLAGPGAVWPVEPRGDQQPPSLAHLPPPPPARAAGVIDTQLLSVLAASHSVSGLLRALDTYSASRVGRLSAIEVARIFHQVRRLFEQTPEAGPIPSRHTPAMEYLSALLTLAPGDFDEEAIADACWGLRNLARHPTVDRLWLQVSYRIKRFEGRLSPWVIALVCESQQNRDRKQVNLLLLRALTRNIEAPEHLEFSGDDIASICSGLGGHCGRPETLALIQAVAKKVTASRDLVFGRDNLLKTCFGLGQMAREGAALAHVLAPIVKRSAGLVMDHYSLALANSYLARIEQSAGAAALSQAMAARAAQRMPEQNQFEPSLFMAHRDGAAAFAAVPPQAPYRYFDPSMPFAYDPSQEHAGLYPHAFGGGFTMVPVTAFPDYFTPVHLAAAPPATTTATATANAAATAAAAVAAPVTQPTHSGLGESD